MDLRAAVFNFGFVGIKYWHKLQQKTPLALITHFIGAVLTAFDVYSDYQTGWEHWEKGNTLWALTTTTQVEWKSMIL